MFKYHCFVAIFFSFACGLCNAFNLDNAADMETVKNVKEIRFQLANIGTVYIEFIDAIEIAAATPRFLVHKKIIELRNIRQKLNYITAISCALDVKESVLKTMDFGIEGFERFADQSSLSQSASFNLFKAYSNRVNREINECMELLKKVGRIRCGEQCEPHQSRYDAVR